MSLNVGSLTRRGLLADRVLHVETLEGQNQDVEARGCKTIKEEVEYREVIDLSAMRKQQAETLSFVTGDHNDLEGIKKGNAGGRAQKGEQCSMKLLMKAL